MEIMDYIKFLQCEMDRINRVHTINLVNMESREKMLEYQLNARFLYESQMTLRRAIYNPLLQLFTKLVEKQLDNAVKEQLEIYKAKENIEYAQALTDYAQ